MILSWRRRASKGLTSYHFASDRKNRKWAFGSSVATQLNCVVIPGESCLTQHRICFSKLAYHPNVNDMIV